ncbi:MAG: AraC family transcriptional regulator [Spirochaetaceae bacterium]|jgi:AraC-like DNA-binding protein|nr:AraC family transcriptional regulator [Spirochaetaceae bacterium]
MKLRINPILAKYIRIFFLFAGLLLLTYIPIYYYVTDFTLKNVLSFTSNKLNSGISAVDAAIGALNNASVTTAGDFRFRFLKYEAKDITIQNNPYALLALRDSFNNMLLSHTIADAGILFSGNMCLTRQGVFYDVEPGLRRFYGSFLRCGGLSQEEWRELLVENRPFAPVQSYESVYYGAYQGITFTVRWSYADFPGENILFAVLPVKSIVPLIAEPEIADRGFIRIYRGDGVILFAQGEDKDKRARVLTAWSAAGRLRYEIGIPSSLLNEKMAPVKRIIFLFTLIAVSLTVLLAILFARLGSKPAEALALRLEESLRIIGEQAQLLRSQIFERIYRALAAGDGETACRVLRECTSALPDSADIADFIAQALTGVIRRLKEENPESLAEVPVPEYAAGNLRDLFTGQFPAAFRDIAKQIRLYQENQFDREVMDYIDARLCDPGLYITMVSERFAISPPTLQKLVKGMTGQTFLAYVESKRLKQAQELLTEGKLNVAETAGLCGFSNAGSFSRAFKRMYGYAPSELLTRRKN